MSYDLSPFQKLIDNYENKALDRGEDLDWIWALTNILEDLDRRLTALEKRNEEVR